MEKLTEDFFKNNLNVLKLKEINRKTRTRDVVQDMKLVRRYLGVYENNGQYDGIFDDLASFNKPFILNVWNKLGERPFRQKYRFELDIYLCAINENELYENLTWKDSIFNEEENIELHNSDDLVRMLIMKSGVAPEEIKLDSFVVSAYRYMLNDFKKQLYNGKLIETCKFKYEGWFYTEELIKLLDENGFIYEVKKDIKNMSTTVQVDLLKTITECLSRLQILTVSGAWDIMSYIRGLHRIHRDIELEREEINFK